MRGGCHSLKHCSIVDQVVYMGDIECDPEGVLDTFCSLLHMQFKISEVTITYMYKTSTVCRIIEQQLKSTL